MAKDGGSVFPWSDGDPRDASAGMSLRDYFAGQALIAVMGSPRWVEGLDVIASKYGRKFADALAEMAFQYADAMIEQRDQKG